MGIFCRFCGKELVNDVCDCEAARTERKKSKMKFDTAEILTICKNFLKNPVGMISETILPDKRKWIHLAGGMHLALILLVLWLRIPSMEWIGIGFGEKLGIGFGVAAFVGFVNLLIICVTFGICKLFKSGRRFGEVLAVFNSTTILLSAGYVVAFITSFVSGFITAVLLMVMLVAWIVLVNEAVVICLGNGRNPGFWITLAAVATGAVVIAIVGQSVLSVMLDNVFGSMGSFLTMW